MTMTGMVANAACGLRNHCIKCRVEDAFIVSDITIAVANGTFFVLAYVLAIC